ncbi:MAG TPA: hypothetical protein RMH99_01790 [Sandaracinaceae bacterium LLY-WYZ-13_1]|nr:hypothetical protein [Sandaracinaceae bacterium LLY-WYZ-13_1]
MMTAVRFALFFLGLAALAPVAEAQTPPDVVRLRDGGLVRGTIIENVPGSHLRMSLTTGEERRFEADDIEWAGPASELPSGRASSPELDEPARVGVPPPADYDSTDAREQAPFPSRERVRDLPPGTPVPAAEPGRAAIVPVRFEVDREDVRIDVRAGTRSWYHSGGVGRPGAYMHEPVFRELCRAPCTHDFVAGKFHIGVAMVDGGRTEPIHEPIIAEGPTRVRIHWGDRSGARVLGGVLWPVLGVCSLPFFIGGLLGLSSYRVLDAAIATVGGSVGLAAAFGFGMGLVFLRDDLSLEQMPLSPSAVPGH